MEKIKPKFAVAVIARNEAKTLPRLVGSLKEFQERGGKIYVLDTGSTDGTQKVGRDLGCEMIEVGERFLIVLDKSLADQINKQFSFDYDKGSIVKEGDKIFDYSSARNFLASCVQENMIAMPDCDEIYTRLDIDAVNKAIDSGVDQLEYNFVFSHGPEGEELIKFMHSKFYNKKRMEWVGVIHEVLSGQGVRKFLDESIIKLEHYQNIETNRSHYLTGLAYDCFINPHNDRNAHYFGRELMYRGFYKSAIKQLQYHVRMEKWPAEASQSMVFIGDCHLERGDRREAMASYVKAFDIDASRREPLIKLAEIYYREKKPDQTIAYVAAALQIKGDNFYANFQPYYENIPHEMMYWALWQKGEVHSSKEHFDLCLAYQPYNPKYLHDMRWYYNLPKMSFILPTKGRPHGLERAIKSIENLDYPQEKKEIIVLHDGEECSKIREVTDDFKISCNSEGYGVPLSVAEGVKQSTGDWIVYCSNDIEFAPDSIMIAFKTAMDNRKLFMAFNTGEVSPDKGNICEHFMIHRKLLPQLGGEIFDTDFHHVGVDNLLHAKLEKLNQFMRCARAIVHHYHFSRPGGKMDEVYEKGWNEENLKADRELLKKKLEELNNQK